MQIVALSLAYRQQCTQALQAAFLHTYEEQWKRKLGDAAEGMRISRGSLCVEIVDAPREPKLRRTLSGRRQLLATCSSAYCVVLYRSCSFVVLQSKTPALLTRASQQRMWLAFRQVPVRSALTTQS